MNINCYEENGKLVIIIEGLENLPSQADIIKGFLTTITGVGVTDIPAPENSEETDEYFFETGDYAGLTPKEVSEKKAKGLLYLNWTLKQGGLSSGFLKEIKEALTEKARLNFSAMTVESMLNLSIDCRRIFLGCYDGILDEKICKELSDVENWENCRDIIRDMLSGIK